MYKVTGTDIHGKRFSIHTNNRLYAFSINAYKGNIWQSTTNGWKKIHSFFN